MAAPSYIYYARIVLGITGSMEELAKNNAGTIAMVTSVKIDI